LRRSTISRFISSSLTSLAIGSLVTTVAGMGHLLSWGGLQRCLPSFERWLTAVT
jgi:hypothetical protein